MPFYAIFWKSGGSFDLKDRLATSAVPFGLEWSLYEKASGVSVPVSETTRTTGVISFSEVASGTYLVHATHNVDGIQCIAKLELAILDVKFKTYDKSISGPGKPHVLNMNTSQQEAQHYDPYEKCMSYIWNTSKLNMASYLKDFLDNKALLENSDIVTWKVETWSGTVSQDSSFMALEDDPPFPGFVEVYKISAVPGSVLAASFGTAPLDRLITTVINEETLKKFKQWEADNDDLSWLDELPAPYETVNNNEDPSYISDPEPTSCSNWEGLVNEDTYYHPGARYSMRSVETSGGHGHQACYGEDGAIITANPDGSPSISGGSADKVAPGWTGHRDEDVHPFIWAIQIDGNPVQATDYFAPFTLDGPIMYEGEFSDRYLNRRPATVDGVTNLAWGECP